jgi:hypothetical protein
MLSKKVPNVKIGQTEDVASAVSYLCSPEAHFITGEFKLRILSGIIIDDSCQAKLSSWMADCPWVCNNTKTNHCRSGCMLYCDCLIHGTKSDIISDATASVTSRFTIRGQYVTSILTWEGPAQPRENKPADGDEQKKQVSQQNAKISRSVDSGLVNPPTLVATHK